MKARAGMGLRFWKKISSGSKSWDAFSNLGLGGDVMTSDCGEKSSRDRGFLPVPLSLVCAVSLFMGLASCSEDDGPGGAGSGGSGAATGGMVNVPGDGDGDQSGDGDLLGDGDLGGDGDIVIPIGDGDGDGDGDTAGPKDGGRVDLTPTQIAEIEEAACVGVSVEGEPVPAVLQLVVDVSQSMAQSIPGGGFQTKWSVTQDALSAAVDALPSTVSVGVLYYPNMSTNGGITPADVSTCVATDEVVPIGLLGDALSTQRVAIEESISDALVSSFTPTYDAYTYALESSLLPYDSTAGSKFMLLITDGAPTFDQGCVNVAEQTGSMAIASDAPTEPIVSKIAEAFTSHGVRTFLIGSPGSETSSESATDMRPWLSGAAVAGGTALEGCTEMGPNFCHLDMTQEPDFAQALTEGLQDVTGQIVDQCTFIIPEAPGGEELDDEETNVVVSWGDGTSSLILKDEVGDCTDGWRMNADGALELCPVTCEQLKQSNLAKVDLSFGCAFEEVIK